MTKIKILLLPAQLIFLLLLTACSKDESAPAKSRDIKFEVTGNYTGRLDATYFTASGGATNESLLSLPWSKSVVYQPSVAATSLTIAGGGGVSGQTLTLKVFAGGKMVSETPGVANSSGIIVIASPTYIF